MASVTGDSNPLSKIPASSFLFHLCPYLTSHDLLALRLVGKQCCDLLHHEQESDTMWKMILKRDFGIDTDSQEDWNQVLNLKLPSPNATSIFGVDFASDDFLLEQKTPYDVWRYWFKTNGRVGFGGSSGDLIYAPYFLRSAKVWKTIGAWCQSEASQDVGGRIRQSFQTAHQEYTTLVRQLAPFKECKSYMAILSVFSFAAGQKWHFRADQAFDGLFGGYHAYGYYSNLSLTTPKIIRVDDYGLMCIVADDRLGHKQSISKSILVDFDSGGVFLLTDSGLERRQSTPPRQDEFLQWLENYTQKLSAGEYRVDTMGTYPHEPSAISLFPHAPLADPLLVTSETIPARVSRAITKGVEVVASAVYAPQNRNQFGFIYCIRMRLLTKGEDGYESEAERGFQGCSLISRSWRITDNASERTQTIEGRGVVGMHPLLVEGGFKNGGDSVIDGVFQYQSCSGVCPEGGSFEGHITFMPVKDGKPSGPPFDVKLHPFLLSVDEPFLY